MNPSTLPSRKKRALCILLCLLLLCAASGSVYATETATVYPYAFAFEDFWYEEPQPAMSFSGSIACKGCVLMEASTGKILYADRENDRLPIASVTKVMATLLIMEAIDGGKLKPTDTVTVSERAASMGGSQVFLEPGEEMTVDELLKSLIVVSANDATVALAEAVCGSEEAFIERMNEKAGALGLQNTHFSNTNGLPCEGHYSSALDIALTTRELLNHKDVLQYTNIWMDTIRNGTFGLANTNKLVRFYKGANGMKTGFTNEAGYCLSGTAKRDGMQLIAVVLGADTSSDRFALAKQLLDFGFANYCIQTPECTLPDPVPVIKGEAETVPLQCELPPLLLEKGKTGKLSYTVTLPDRVQTPVAAGQVLGSITFCIDGKPVAKADLCAAKEVKRLEFSGILRRILTNIFHLL